MPTAAWTRIVIGLAALFSFGLSLAYGARIDSAFLRAVLPASSAVILVLIAFDRWLWRWPVVNLLLSRPVLHGTWRTELKTSYAERANEPIEAYLVIDQTYSKICVRMLFDRSQSVSMSGDLVIEGGGSCVLYYVFRSDKHALEPESNPPARGAADLKVGRQPALHLEGDYWMERGTKGRIQTTGHTSSLFDTFSSARGGTYR